MDRAREEKLRDYMVPQWARRADELATLFMGFTAREQSLIREASVAGYVRGMMAVRAGATGPPSDLTMVKEVLDTWLSMPDLYPTATAYEEEENNE